jgi:hypothetical protein
MNHYYIDYHGNAFALRCNGIKFEPTKGETRIPSDKALRLQSQLGMIPTYAPQKDGSLVRL